MRCKQSARYARYPDVASLTLRPKTNPAYRLP
jgi:hypothetical protein